jgi:hypothetical protein
LAFGKFLDKGLYFRLAPIGPGHVRVHGEHGGFKFLIVIQVQKLEFYIFYVLYVQRQLGLDHIKVRHTQRHAP